MNCRYCATPLDLDLIDLGTQPPSNSLLTLEDLKISERYYPLRVKICRHCKLVQTEDFASRELFFNHDYPYFSSTSHSWVEHAKSYSIAMIDSLDLDESNFVVEIASNDGYLLRNFVAAGVPCLGVEPTLSTAQAAIDLGIPTIIKFFDQRQARNIIESYTKADLVICNNVFAHVPDVNDFTQGLSLLLAAQGVITLEFPHLLNLVKFTQFDTIYHEHYSYFSIETVTKILTDHGLRIFDVQKLGTHGGSLRIYVCHDDADHITTSRVGDIVEEERAEELTSELFNGQFQLRAQTIKNDLIKFLINVNDDGKKICGYGAAAKGNTLLNFAGIKADLLPFVADASHSKINKFLPGSRIPILEPSSVEVYNPDYVLVLPWNIAPEIKLQFSKLANRGCKFITFSPDLREV